MVDNRPRQLRREQDSDQGSRPNATKRLVADRAGGSLPAPSGVRLEYQPNLQNGKQMQYTEEQIADKVATLKAVNQVIFDNRLKLGMPLLDLWFIDTVEERILDSKGDYPSWVMKKSMDQILSLYFEQDVFFSLMYGYDQNSEEITDWLIKNGCMVDVDEDQDSTRDLVADHEQTRMADAEMGDL